MTHCLKVNLGALDDMSKVEIHLYSMYDEVTITIEGEDNESLIDKIYSTLRKKGSEIIHIKSNLYFKIYALEANSLITLQFYKIVNGNMQSIDNNLMDVLDSEGITKGSIISALRNPKVIDSFTISDRVREIVEKDQGKVELNESKEQEQETKKQIILNNRRLIVIPIGLLVGETEDSIGEINDMLKNPNFKIPSKFYNNFLGTLINIYENGSFGGYDPYEDLPLEKKQNKYIKAIEEIFGKVNREEVLKIIEKRILS